MAPAPSEEETVEALHTRVQRGEFFSPGFDPRFPNMNQAKRCWVNFVDFHRCVKQKGDEYEPCYYFKKVYNAICPHAWVGKWQEQLEAGTFPYDFEKDLKNKHGVEQGHGHNAVAEKKH